MPQSFDHVRLLHCHLVHQFECFRIVEMQLGHIFGRIVSRQRCTGHNHPIVRTEATVCCVVSGIQIAESMQRLPKRPEVPQFHRFIERTRQQLIAQIRKCYRRNVVAFLMSIPYTMGRIDKHLACVPRLYRAVSATGRNQCCIAIVSTWIRNGA